MNILIIISQYHPAQTPNTLRWQPLISAMQAAGHQVSVLTTKRRGWPLSETVDGLAIYRAGYNSLLDRLYDLLNRQARRNETNTGGSNRPGLFTSIIQRLVDKTWRRTYWPDGSRLFLKPGIKKGKDLLKSHNIERVISVGLPFTSHLIGQSLKEAQPDLHWHMDIQDPFCYSKEFWVNNFEKYSDRNMKAEKEAFESADSISVTNAVAKKRYVELFPSQANKIAVVPPLFSKPIVDEDNKDAYYDMQLYADKTHLTYAGSFYTGVRSIEPFLKFLNFLFENDPQLFDEIQFHFLGQLDARTMETINAYPKIRRWFVLHGFKNRNQTMAALLQTDLVMNFGNSTDYHLPSKVVDYFYLNKPLINFISTEKDSTQAFFLDKSLSILNLNLSESKLEGARNDFISYINSAKASEVKVSKENVTDYTPEKLVTAYLTT